MIRNSRHSMEENDKKFEKAVSFIRIVIIVLMTILIFCCVVMIFVSGFKNVLTWIISIVLIAGVGVFSLSVLNIAVSFFTDVKFIRNSLHERNEGKIDTPIGYRTVDDSDMHDDNY